MKTGYDSKFRLGAVLWLSISLSVPITDALGYATQGFLLRLAIIVASMLLLLLFSTYPMMPVGLTLVGAVAWAISYFAVPDLFAAVTSALVDALLNNQTLRFAAVLFAITCAVLLIVSHISRRRMPVLLCLGLSVFAPLWYLYIDSAYWSAVSYAIGWLLLLAYHTGERIWRRMPREDLDDFRRGWMRYAGVSVLLVLAVSLLLPKNMPAVEWTALQIWADETFPFLADLRGGEPHSTRGDGGTFSIAVAGFGEPARLGGPVRDDPLILLEVQGARRHYLRGSAWQEYTGSAWVSPGSLTEWTPMEVHPELSDLLRPASVKISHTRLRTTTVFTLLYTTEVIGLGDSIYMTEGHTAVRTSEVIRNQAYQVNGMTLAYRGNFSSLSNGTHEPVLTPWLQLPTSLPQRVIDIALSLTAPHETDFAKMKALESYLRSTFPYSKDAAELPEGRDFVDFFLFEEKTGYCTSYATSLAVMARVAGIPSRYVQGFRMPTDAGPGGIYSVAGSDAHAWVEAFIHGIGWFAFEATPGFPTSDSLPVRLEPVTPGEGQDGPDPGPPPDREPSFWDELPFIVDGEAVTEKLTQAIRVSLAIFPLALLLILGMAVLAQWLRLRNSLARIERLPAGPREIAYYNVALALLAAMSLAKAPGETPREYSIRVNRHVYDWKLDFRQISEGVSLCLYSKNCEVPDELQQQTRDFYYSIYSRYVVVAGRRTAFVDLYIKGRHLTRELFGQITQT